MKESPTGRGSSQSETPGTDVCMYCIGAWSRARAYMACHTFLALILPQPNTNPNCRVSFSRELFENARGAEFGYSYPLNLH
jgi:hypothetical protein